MQPYIIIATTYLTDRPQDLLVLALISTTENETYPKSNTTISKTIPYNQQNRSIIPNSGNILHSWKILRNKMKILSFCDNKKK